MNITAYMFNGTTKNLSKKNCERKTRCSNITEMKYYHLLGNVILTILYFIASQVLGTENDITQEMMAVADMLVETSDRMNDELYPHYYENLTSALALLNEIALAGSRDNNLNKYKEHVDQNIYKSLNGDDTSVILPEVLATRFYYLLKSRMGTCAVVDLVFNRLKNMTGTKRGASDPRKDFQDRFSAQLFTELSKDANDDEQFENAQNYWKPKPSNNTRRLLGAAVTSIHDYPFMVSVYVANRFWCSGVIYWHDIVLTTASCLQLLHNNRFYRENPRAVKVRVGSNVSLAGGELVEASEIYFYPGYKPKTLSHNIAIIRLRYWIFFDKDIPKIIKLSKAKNSPSIMTRILVLASGADKASGLLHGPGDLRYQSLPIYPNVMCSDIYTNVEFEYRTMFCGGTLGSSVGACNHDVGGAAIYQSRLLGLVSHGPPTCGLANSPTIFTHIGYYANWIKKINASMPHYYRSTVPTTTTPNATTPPPTTPSTTPDDAPVSDDAAAETTLPEPAE